MNLAIILFLPMAFIVFYGTALWVDRHKLGAITDHARRQRK